MSKERYTINRHITLETFSNNIETFPLPLRLGHTVHVPSTYVITEL